LNRYRALSSRKAFRVRKVSQEHADILAAVLAHDCEMAVALLQRHFERTAEVIRADLENVSVAGPD
jgi:DNA-binding GntR family transcriptional regulator